MSGFSAVRVYGRLQLLVGDGFGLEMLANVEFRSAVLENAPQLVRGKPKIPLLRQRVLLAQVRGLSCCVCWLIRDLLRVPNLST